MALGAAAEPSFLIYGNPRVPAVPDWLSTPLAGAGRSLGEDTFSLLVIAMFGCYLAALRFGDALTSRATVAAVAVLHAGVLLAPPILSGDAFSYLAYARLYAVHGLDPYRHPAADAPGDPLLPFVGIPGIESPYGPLFTLFTVALVPLGVAAGMWVLKLLAVGGSLACAALTWGAATRLGRSPQFAVAFVVLNPLWILYAVGGAHNDLPMAVFVLLGLFALAGGTARAETLGAAALVSAVAVKATAGVALLFALAGARRRLRTLGAALAAAATLTALAALAFGDGLLGYLDVLGRQGRSVSIYSVWLDLSRLAGYTTVPAAAKTALALAFATALVLLLVRTARGSDWIAGAGWAVLALLVCTTWLLPWYVVLLLPLAALGSSGALRAATLAFCAVLLVTRLPLLLA